MTVANPAIPSERAIRSALRAFVRGPFWPLYVAAIFGVMIAGYALGLRDESRAALAVGTLLGVMLIEQLVPRTPRGIVGDPQLRQDIGLFVLVGITEALTGLALIGAGMWLGGQLHAVVGVTLWPVEWPWPAQALLAFLAADFLDYWVHRISHRAEWLWSIHVHHHDTERLHVFKGTRNHPFAGVTRLVGAYLPLLVVGAPLEMLFWYQVFIQSIGSVGHANLDMRFPRWLHRVLVTPPVHWVHHARAHALHDRNFAAFTPLWDILFGTYEPPDAHAELDYGVGDPAVPKDILRRLIWPFVWWRAR